MSLASFKWFTWILPQPVPDTILALSLLLRRVYMTHHQSKNLKDKGDSPLPYQYRMCWSLFITPGLTLPFRTTVSAASALLSHLSQPDFIQIPKCLSIPSAGFTQNHPALCCPIQITISYPLFWLQTQNRLKGEGRFSCVPWCSALLHPLWDGRFSGNTEQEAQRSQCPSSPGVHNAVYNPPRSALKPLLLRGFCLFLEHQHSTSVE